MKKLMVMAVVAVAAACTQAATFSWQGSYVADSAGGLAADGLPVYLFVASTAGVGYDANGSVLSAGTWSLSDITGAVSDGTFVSGNWASKAVDQTAVATMSYVGTSANFTGIDNGSSVLLAAVFVDSTASAPDVKAAFLITSDAVTLDTISGVATWDTGWDPYGLSYTTQTVPEPTSGLLLLLGVAGLALRRRRA